MGHNTFNYFLLVSSVYGKWLRCYSPWTPWTAQTLNIHFSSISTKFSFPISQQDISFTQEKKNHNHITINYIISINFSICYLY